MPINPDKTIQGQWERYKKGCYPAGMDIAQAVELRQAFFAGALTFRMLSAGNTKGLSPKDANKAYIALLSEATAAIEEHRNALKQGIQN